MQDKKKPGKAKKSTKATFKVSRAKKGLKKGKDSKESSSGSTLYKGKYDLSELPKAALPNSGKTNGGVHSYTLSDNQGARIEVLLRNRAFYVKRLSDSGHGSGPTGQISFSKYDGPAKAWAEAIHRSGYKA